MQRYLIILALLLAWSAGATIFCAHNEMLNGFSGIFLRAFTGYCLIIAVTHFILLFLPKVGIGADPRTE
jgi:hypothetical protein